MMGYYNLMLKISMSLIDIGVWRKKKEYWLFGYT
jgi:hypothetical protein